MTRSARRPDRASNFQPGYQLDLFAPADLGEQAPQGAPTVTRVVASDADFVQLLHEVEAADWVAFDTETTGLDMTQCELVGLSFCVREGHGWYVPVAPLDDGEGAAGDAWSLKLNSAHWASLRRAMTQTRARLAAHNAKFDMGVLQRHGIDLAMHARPIFDTLIAQFAVDPFLRGGMGLKALAKRHFGWDMTEITDLIGGGRVHGRGPGRGRKGGRESFSISMREVPLEMAAPYAAADADATWRLAALLRPQIDRLGLTRLLDEIEFPLLPVLVDMELAGVAIDLPYLSRMSDELHQRLQQLEDDIHRYAGRRFNVSSPQQLSGVLYQMLGLHLNFADVQANLKDHRLPSTRGHRLATLKDAHPIVPLVVEHRELTKLLGTYIDALPMLINPTTGRVHTHFNQAVVITGRLSSSAPNLQNVPIATEVGRRVRQAFIAREGAQVISADYSQIELRVLAHLADDAGLKAAFAREEDIHASTAAAIYGVPIHSVTGDQRGYAKRINYGIAYGMSSYSLARGTGMSDADAERFMAQYFKRFAGVKRWLDGIKRKLITERVVETLYGRRRPFAPLGGPTRQPPAELRRDERLAVNHPVQGTAAEIVKLAMIGLHKALKADGYQTLLTLQVHDELVLDVPHAEVPAVRELLRHEMEHAIELAAPLRADISVGANWDSEGE